MSESKSLVKLQTLLLMSDPDMAAAAQQLMQLNDEDNNISSSNSTDNNNMKTKAKMTSSNSRRFFEHRDEITSAKIEEICGKEDEILRPIKKRRYRLLQNLYKETKPLKVSATARICDTAIEENPNGVSF